MIFRKNHQAYAHSLGLADITTQGASVPILAVPFLARRIFARLAPDHLRGLPVGAEKGAAHSVAIAKSGLLRDDVKGVAGVFQQRPRPLQAEVLDRLRRRLAGLGLERAAELAR